MRALDGRPTALVLAADEENDPDVLAINGASPALALSKIPVGKGRACPPPGEPTAGTGPRFPSRCFFQSAVPALPLKAKGRRLSVSARPHGRMERDASTGVASGETA